MVNEHRPLDLLTDDVKLVWGGTPDKEGYRMEECSYMLNPVSEEITQAYYDQIQAKTCRKGLIAVLKHMEENNIAIVGTRGYVYTASGQASLVENFNPWYENALTRGMGIRDKMKEIYMRETSIEKE
ncbi:hypothetical protein HWD03_gp140 [Alteromonas phage vB_AmeM_PT11-V22]|uniref:Uncharacterized protein n=1 Tax=Alteromonas phage vB_AmeM_PT11-V22 TaxID=2704031 RepID=A0A6C0R0T8_9CAUD|nr:hypothetical protein HWD03_gp140 [Alteromonas phage vB_AmeM_PT11-V22]QHZ59870.1 hypothetical protein [Alteromonas phage vB_AmeM_PT11-V22]